MIYLLCRDIEQKPIIVEMSIWCEPWLSDCVLELNPINIIAFFIGNANLKESHRIHDSFSPSVLFGFSGCHDISCSVHWSRPTISSLSSVLYKPKMWNNKTDNHSLAQSRTYSQINTHARTHTHIHAQSHTLTHIHVGLRIHTDVLITPTDEEIIDYADLRDSLMKREARKTATTCLTKMQIRCWTVVLW